jgi:hypothetical protein
LALALLAYLLWRGSGPFRAGGWRIGAGLSALGLIVVGIVLAIRGDEWIGLPLAAGGLLVALVSRVNRRARRPAPTPPESMSLAQARSILGVTEDASPKEVKAAHMRLMKLNHPDRGGTSGLAAQLNAARDRLSRRADR